MKRKDYRFAELLNIPEAKLLIEGLEDIISEANEGNKDKQEIVKVMLKN